MFHSVYPTHLLKIKQGYKYKDKDNYKDIKKENDKDRDKLTEGLIESYFL